MSEHISDSDLLLAFDGELPRDRDETVQAHARTCAQCGKKWRRLEQLSGNLAALSPDVRLQPQDEAVTALVACFDGNAPARNRPVKRPASRYLVFANALGAVAAAVICVIMWPSLQGSKPGTNHAVVHPDAVYDFEQAVPAGYVSLPFADPALPLDDATILPVEMSAEDLEMMGLDSGETLPTGLQTAVKAEILIGMDGWPRAIRIVEQ
jgi:hypothetical protein